MNGQLRLNVILPIVLLAAAGAALSLFMLSRGAGASTTAADSVAPLPRVVAPKPGRTARPAKPSTPEAPPKPARPKVKLNAGLPTALARALTARPVAVVAFVTPDARLDEMAAKEAAAGARAGGASFLTVDVSRSARRGRSRSSSAFSRRPRSW